MKLTEIAPGLLAPKAGRHVPPAYVTKARSLICRFHRGERIYKEISLRGSGLWKINMGGTWRLLSRNHGRTWTLLAHEHYIREIHQCR
jgi:hypothetical protein